MTVFTPDDINLPHRPSNSKLIVGSQGLPVAQGEKQEQITRQGAAAAEADFDVKNDGSYWDLISDGDWQIPEDVGLETAPDIGGTDEFAAAILSEDSGSFEFKVQWTEPDGQILYEESFTASDGDLLIESVTVKSDLFNIVLTDTSGAGQNRVRGTINFH